MEIITALLVLFGIMGSVCSVAICRDGCIETNMTNTTLIFNHVLEFQNTSVAPWELKTDTDNNRTPEHLLYAECKVCRVNHMVAKPIHLQIYVFQTVRSSGKSKMCKCPFKLAVGCTCVKE